MPPPPDVAALLDSLGLAIGTHQVEIIDFHQAESAYVHHSRIPVAAVGYALVSPTFAQGRFPKLTFIDLIRKRPAMDEIEVQALAAVCGVEIEPVSSSNPDPFGDELWKMIDLYDLGAFFQMLEVPYGGPGSHYYMRPRGFDWGAPDDPINPGALERWRSNYRKLEPYRQLLVATILQLYLQRDDEHWMIRVPKKWHAAEAIKILNGDDALTDWATLYALYPGW